MFHPQRRHRRPENVGHRPGDKHHVIPPRLMLPEAHHHLVVKTISAFAIQTLGDRPHPEARLVAKQRVIVAVDRFPRLTRFAKRLKLADNRRGRQTALQRIFLGIAVQKQEHTFAGYQRFIHIKKGDAHPRPPAQY